VKPDPSDVLPPAWAERLLRLALRRGVADRTILGDLREEFTRRAARDADPARRGYRRAALDLCLNRWRDVLLRRAHGAHQLQHSHRRGDHVMQQLLRDIRYAIRTLLRSPAFTLITAVTLALGIGANTAIFSVVNGVLLRPLPFDDADAVVGVFHTAPGLGYPQFGMSPGIFVEYAQDHTVLDDIGLYTSFGATLASDGGEPERVQVGRVTRSLFSTLRVTPRRGRVFSAAEDSPSGASVVLLGHGLWQRRFGADPDVIGQSLRVSGVTREIIGVMPPGFAFPNDETDLWIPFGLDPTQAAAGAFNFASVARVKPGVAPNDVERALAPALIRVRERVGTTPQFIAFMEAGQLAPLVHSYKEEIVGDLRAPLMILLGTVAVVLVIACVNVANLSLVRAEGRRRELAVRTALGAGRPVLIRQFLVESGVLAAAGGLGGLVLAAVGVPVLVRLAPDNLPRLQEVGMDLPVLAYALVISAVAALAFGLAPAIRHTAPGLLVTLRQSGRGSTGGHRQYVRNLLVGGQAGLALLLLVGSGLMVRSFWRIQSVDPGFNWDGVLTFNVALPSTDYPTPMAIASFHSRLLDRLRALPGVTATGATSNLPLGNTASGTAHEIEDHPTPAGSLPPMLWFNYVAPGFFEAMQIPVVRGRAFERADHEQPVGNVMVSQALANRFWPSADAVGRRIRLAGDSTPWYTIVGVVGSVRDRGLREDPSEMVYYPMVGPALENDWSVPNMVYTIRAPNAEVLAGPVRAAIREIDPGLPVVNFQMMDRVVADSVVRLSFTMLALVIATVMALVLGAVGLYGVLSYLVSQRTQEIGLRIALGAQPGQVRAMIVSQGFRIVAVGLVVGLGGAVGLTRLLQGLLYETAPLDPMVFGLMSAVLIGVGIAASYIPARRASAVDPVRSLRMD
jgi:predicted permease